MVKLRFMRIGKKNRPYYRLCVVDVRRQRGGEYLESIGVYDPLIADDVKKIRIDKERAEYWLSRGAQPTEVVFSFLKKAHVAGLIRHKKPRHERPAPQPSAALSTSTRKPKPPKKPRAPKAGKGKTGTFQPSVPPPQE